MFDMCDSMLTIQLISQLYPLIFSFITYSFCGSGNYDMHGPAKDCDCCGSNVGGNKMCVWHTLGK